MLKDVKKITMKLDKKWQPELSLPEKSGISAVIIFSSLPSEYPARMQERFRRTLTQYRGRS